MKFTAPAKARRRPFLTLFALAFVTALVLVPTLFRSEATTRSNGEGLFSRTVSQRDELPNYDIRSDKAAASRIESFRSSQSRNAVEVADVRDGFVQGEKALAARVPTLKVEYNTDIRTPEVIATEASLGKAYLTRATSAKRADVLKSFLAENNELVGMRGTQVSELKVFSDYTNPDGNLSFVELNQEINGIPVFRGEVKAAFTKDGEMGRVVNNLAPGLNYASLSMDFGDAADAVRYAAANINHDLKQEESAKNAAASSDLKAVFGSGDWATTAEKIYFPTEPGVAVPAWRVLIWQPVNAFYVIVDAHTGTMLWRKNLTEDQSQAATYQVYVNPNAMINVADSAAPLSPYISAGTSPADGAQGSLLTRTNVSRIGNEAPYTFNNNGWITDGANTTDGNALESGLDLDAVNGVDAGTQATGSPNRTFSSLWNPPPGNPAPGDAPTTAEARRGAVIQQFYIMNWYHDELYRLGFTEQARNFQNDNFGRGGLAGDRVSAEGQDSSGTNNANFSAGVDGTRGRMQMYVWSGPNPDRDGTGDADIMIHEVTHGTSNRLHGNNAGLSLNMSRAMGEGWSDFYAHSLLSEPTDPVNGLYALSGYALFQGFGVVGNASYYYGIRRFPKAVMAATGGPQNRPYNPMTFADIDSTQANTSDGAFAAMAGPHISTSVDQVHAAGEVWSSALWEVRAKFVTRLGWLEGNRRALQFVTDGMKLAPIGPTFLTERNAILAAAQMSGTGADVADIWSGFAIRGMGFSSSIQNVGTGVGDARVTEAFDLPNLTQTTAFSVSDAGGNNNGFPEPGEPVTVTVPLSNITGNSATGVTAQIVGGGSANYGTINNNATVSQPISFTIPAGTLCGSALTLTINVNSSLGATSFQRTINIGVQVVTLTQNFDGVTAPALPAGWTVGASYAPMTFAATTNSADTAPNSIFGADLPDCVGTTTQCPTTNGGDTTLTSPAMPITAQASTLSFRHRYNTEAGWDGGVLEISIGGGGFVDVVSAGGAFISNGYNGSMGVSAPNPLGGRNGWTGDSAGYITSVVRLPAAAAGQNVQLRWRLGADSNTAPAGGGWNIDTVQVFGSYLCPFTSAPVKSRADFDADGKTDLSVFRPSEGNWYLNRSSAGFTVANWGVSSDQLAPGDFDGDNKTDVAVFRPSTGTWWILRSSDNGFSSTAFGLSGDVPVAGDYDGDNKSDLAVFRPSTNVWYVLKSTGGTIISAFGAAGDLPVPGDYDNDAKTDIAVYRSGQWWIDRSSGGVSATNFGLATDRAVPADYDGDGKDDIAVYRPSNGTWYILRSTNGGVDFIPFGLPADIPVPGDYDGDGKDDQAVYRNGVWYLNRSASGFFATSFGVSSDTAVPAEYIP
ncbi:MAG TPA: M36 family metallopeptidase [Pyrinomonadaceae bacterium]|nr:M36 family metallopeptidase [Pyrinomonadaceae bacterium]